MKHTTVTRHFAAIGRYQQGASLLEGIAYLGIAAIVILGAVSLLTGAFSSAQANRLSEELIAMRTGIKKLYMSQSSGYGTVSLSENLKTARLFPSTMSVSTATPPVVTNSFGGLVDVTGATNFFTISYAAIPQDVCLSAISGASGWFSISNGTDTITESPVTLAGAATLCANNAAAGNTIIFTAS